MSVGMEMNLTDSYSMFGGRKGERDKISHEAQRSALNTAPCIICFPISFVPIACNPAQQYHGKFEEKSSQAIT